MFRFLSSSFQHQGWVCQILISDIQWMSERCIWWVRAIDNFQLNSDRNDPIAGGGELLWWRDVFACESHAERHWLRDFHVKRADQGFQWPCSRLGGNSIALSIFVDILGKPSFKKSAVFFNTRPKPAYGRQGLDWDRWARIQFSQVHFGAKLDWTDLHD